MFVVVTVTKNTRKSFDVGARLIRAEAAVNVVVLGTGAALDYPLNDRDRRTKNTHLEIDDTQADIVTAMDLAYNAVSLTLPIYPDEDITQATVDSAFSAGDVLWGEAYVPDATKSWIYVQEGAFRVDKKIVDYTLAELVNLAGTGTP